MTRFVAPAAIVAIMLGVASASADAGTFDLTVCDPTAHVTAANGWSELNPDPAAHYHKGCSFGAFEVGVESTTSATPANFQTGWQLALPAPLTIQDIDIGATGSVTLWSGWTTEIWGKKPGQAEWLDERSCAGEACTMSADRLPMYDVRSIAFGIRCASSGCAAGSHADMRISMLKLHITDPNVPVITSLSDTLANSSAAATGIARLAFHVTDPESGVRAVALEIDGNVVAGQSFDTPARSCHPPFTVPMPCPREADGSLMVDTFQLLDGPHQARLLAYDATSTNVGIAGPWVLTTSNRTVAGLCPSTVGASAVVRLRPRTARYGHGAALSVRWPTIPWPNAEAFLLTGVDRLTVSTTAASNRADQFKLDVPAGVNRVVRVGIRPQGSTGPFVCTKPQHVRVHAGVALRAKPRRLRNGHRVFLRGHLAGGQVARGRAIVLEARAKHGRRRWTPVKVVKTGHHGRFRFAYRFTRTVRRTAFYFRARVAPSRGFPYAGGRSRRQKVIVTR